MELAALYAPIVQSVSFDDRPCVRKNQHSDFTRTGSAHQPMRLFAIFSVGIILVACSGKRTKAPHAAAPHGPLAVLMTQHSAATCGMSARTYAATFWRAPYQTCSSTIADSSESAEIDADSVVVELYNTWTVAPTAQAGLFSQAEGELTSQFGSPRQCSPSKVEWRQGNSLHMVLQIAPVSQTGTEFDAGPYRMTRMARLGGPMSIWLLKLCTGGRLLLRYRGF